MSAIRAVTSVSAALYNPYRAASSPAAKPPAAPAESTSREQELTRQIDTRLTEKLNHIRKQISPDSPTTGPRQVNILA